MVRFLCESDLIGKAKGSGERQVIQVIEAIIDLRTANLSGVDLSVTNLNEANLTLANLRGANLRSASLFGANLSDANLRYANLKGVKGWTNEQLAQAEPLVGATLPDGTKMTEEGWEEFKQGYRH